MHSYSKLSVRDLLDAFAASHPVPAGGSAAALTGATATSLLMMVAGLPRTRTSTASESAALTDAAERLAPLRATLTGLVDDDARTYESVLTAFRLPATGEQQAATRRQAIATAMRAAADTQLETMRACREALREAIVIAEHGARSAQGDVGMAIELLRAAARGASANVGINLASVKDEAEVKRIAAEREQLDAGMEADATRGLGLLAHSTPTRASER